MSQEIVIGGGKRTPFGDFGKSLRDTPLSQLATHAAHAALMDAKVEPTDVDHLVWGNVLPVDPTNAKAVMVVPKTLISSRNGPMEWLATK